jgi:hypothetical protein
MSCWEKAPLKLTPATPSEQKPPVIITFDVAPNNQQRQVNAVNEKHNKEVAALRQEGDDANINSNGDASRGESKRSRDDGHNDHKQKGHRVKPSQRS